ncbi:MAG: alanine dehydrogenase [Anaerolineales bacterium]|jgi:alanine dehydrogenase
MTAPRTLGLPRMHKEAGELRVFLPPFVQFVSSLGVNIYIEEGYGSRSGYAFEDYKLASPLVHGASKEEAYGQEVVLVLRSPKPDEFKLMRPEGILFSMLHFPTRPLRIQRLLAAEIRAISMDSIVNDVDIRLVENMKAVAWNGLEAAFDVLEKRWPGLRRPDSRPIQVLVLGTGMVGKYAVDAGTKLGNVERNTEHMTNGGLGAVALAVGRNVSSNAQTMEDLLRQADILVDATQRRDSSKPVVPNEWIGWLPEHAVVVDLAVDPYTLNAEPPVVRGVEGIPQGNLDQFIFGADDPNWDQTVPEQVNSKNRRTAITCYSWPGVHAEACMTHYAQQLEPFIEVLFDKGYDDLSILGEYYERALYRGTLKYFLQEKRLAA